MVKTVADWQKDTTDQMNFGKPKIDLFTDEVLFLSKGDVKSLKAGSSPIDFVIQFIVI